MYVYVCLYVCVYVCTYASLNQKMKGKSSQVKILSIKEKERLVQRTTVTFAKRELIRKKTKNLNYFYSERSTKKKIRVI